MEKIRVGTRGSLLAFRQCYALLAELQVRHWEVHRELLAVEVIPIRTEGDRAQGTPAAATVSKKAWVADIERALMDGQVDLAIHSGKDLPHDIEPGTGLASVGERRFPGDVFVGRLVEGQRLKYSQIQSGMTVGTGSTRRSRFLRAAIPGLNVVEHRGNVPTRIRKLDEMPQLDGIILAEAGLRRLGIEVEYDAIPLDVLVPAQNQGTLVAQFRTLDIRTIELLKLVQNTNVERTFEVERQISFALGADCGSCLGVFAQHTQADLAVHIRSVSSEGMFAEAKSSISIARVDTSPEQGIQYLIQQALSEAYANNVEVCMKS